MNEDVTRPGGAGDNPEPSVTSDTGYWSIVPEWLLDTEVSDRAIRLYAALGRWADDAGLSHPSRLTLAKRLRCSESSVDRAIKELVEARALDVERRQDAAGDWTSNRYRLYRSSPVSRGGVTRDATGGATRDATGGVTGDERTRASSNQSQGNERENPRPSPATPPPEKFTITADLRDWCDERGITADLRLETQKFLTRKRADKATSRDWVEEWKLWMLRILDRRAA